MKARFLGILVVIAIMSLATFVMAATGEKAEVTVGATGQITGTPSIAGNTTTEGGNVTRVDVETNASTSKWAGFYGNVSGNILLGLGSSVLYNFGSADVTAVYATQNSSFAWGSIDEGVAAELDTVFNFNTAADVDQAADVFTGNIGSIDGLTAVPSTQLADTNFNCYIADQMVGATTVEGDYAFGGEVVNAGAAGFDGSDWQYELLVPISAGTEKYFFFMTV